MTTKKHLVLLLMSLSFLVTVKGDVYCEIKESFAHYPKLDIICKNISIEQNEVINVKGQVQNKIDKIQLISVSAEVQSSTLQNFPEAQQLLILDSTIKSFSLQSSITTLNVSNSILPTITSEALKGKDLLSVNFMSNYGLEFEKGAFKHLNALRELTIVNQTIPRIQRHLFTGLVNLRYLCLIGNNIEEIDDDAFLDLSSLERLFLDVNPIKTFSANLRGLTNLERLSLSNTNLKRLNFDVLEPVKSLTSIGLPRQLLKTINVTDLVTSIPDLRMVGIDSMELQCPDVISFMGELKKKEVRVMPVKIEDIWYHYPDIDKPSVCS
ncbi:P-granule-associated novel protein 1-like [Anoplophora glabripennis]|uniref:P-granule-associated novel protein 1-like n=1 Tax=Anoplophora glabripennis TaxID=217634 RepID=UPI000874563E|nr:P-granule-associated novel protein 1-like [Anoplophora glabripennis]XP_023312638.1 P-granule-associated novel protein 1-like [Anoplophora glabripennis]